MQMHTQQIQGKLLTQNNNIKKQSVGKRLKIICILLRDKIKTMTNMFTTIDGMNMYTWHEPGDN